MNGREALEHEQFREWLLRNPDDLSRAERESRENHLETCEGCRIYARGLQTLEGELRDGFHARWDEMPIPQFEEDTPRGLRMSRLPALAVTSLAILLILVYILRNPLGKLLNDLGSSPTNEPVVSAPGATHTTQQVVELATAPVSDGSLIAFVSRRDGNREIYTITAQGENPTNLTQNAAQDYAPVWSPDGEQIAFISDRNGQPELLVMRKDGSQVTELSQVPGARAYGEPSWSPDGEQLAVQLILEYPFTGEPYTQIYLVAADGTGSIAMTQTEFPLSSLEPVWSPIGDRIASRTLGIVNAVPQGASQGDPEQIKLSRGLANVGTLAWSPDGSHLAYFVSCQYCIDDQDIHPSVHLIEADGDNPHVLVAFEEQDLYGLGLSWSPDGSQILLLAVGEQSGNQELYLITPDGLQATRLANLPAGAMDRVPSWSPDGSKLVYALQENGEAGIYILNIKARLSENSSGEAVRLGASREGDTAPRWQP